MIVALLLLIHFEGYAPHCYWDVNALRAGYGHTVVAPETCAPSETEARAWLIQDYHKTEKIVNYLVRVKLTQNQLAALTSLTLNIGTGALQRSQLLLLLNEGNYLTAANEFLKYDKSQGRTLPRLTARRIAERKLFLTP